VLFIDRKRKRGKRNEKRGEKKKEKEERKGEKRKEEQEPVWDDCTVVEHYSGGSITIEYSGGVAAGIATSIVAL
jgi:hypothetical protein